MALLLVLLLLSMTLGLSYAAMRGTSTAGMIQRNADRRAAARQAAVTGLQVALKRMHVSNSWTGVDSTLSGSLGNYESYSVAYSTGDPRLVSSDPQQPYRVTLLSTGRAVDPNNPTSSAVYRVRAVVALVPRKLADAPSSWDTMTGYTAYQWTWGFFELDVPARIEGPVRMQTYFGPQLDLSYDWCDHLSSSEISKAYHNALRDMQASLGDHRPFSGRVDSSVKIFTLFDGMTVLGDLGVTRNNVSSTSVSLSFPGSFSSYRLYPGGKLYNVVLLPQTVQSTTIYQADPESNPAGLFVRSGSLTIGDNATIVGTMISTNSRITISGTNVSLSAVNLPALHGTSKPIQLPVAVADEDFRVSAGAQATIAGLVAANEFYRVEAADDGATRLTHNGNLIAGGVVFSPRSDWSSKSSSWWNSRYYSEFKVNPSGYAYFPAWLKRFYSLEYAPRLKITPPAADSVQYHWHNPQKTIYEPLASDGGLRWNLLDWNENL